MNRDFLFKQAENALIRGQTDDAIDYLTQILGEDSDFADAHALLALALVKKKRLYAARVEAHRSLELEPESFFSHIAVASIEIAARNFTNAENHLETALSIQPESAYAREKLARLYFMWDKPKAAKEQITLACELDPDDLDCLTTKATFLHHEGNYKEAEILVREVLENEPEHLDALVLLGHILLKNGDVVHAKENAIWALSLDPNDEAALQLLISIKARESLLLGIWWRFQSFLSSGSSTRAIVLLIAMFVLYRASMILLDANNLSDWTNFVSAIWVAFCIYTWVAPNIFRRKLQNELKQVELSERF